LRDQASELTVMREKAAERGRSVVRFQQVYQGIPVLGGELIVNLDEAKNILSLHGEILPNIAIKTTPTIDTATAQHNALQAVAKKYQLSVEALTVSQPKLWIYNPMLIRPGSGFTSLVWRMEVTPKELYPLRELILIDAQRGSVILSFNQVDTARNRETYTANNGTTLPGTLVCNESNPTCSGGDSHAVAAHTYAGDTYDFYWNYHGRDSINNAGMTIKSTVHYRTNYANAFWNGSQMVYGDAYGFPLADDVVAHELTHGVTDYESNLFYYYQSGAINESFSDLWGEFVDLTNGKGNDNASVRWLVGEDISGLGAIRNMQNPPAFNDPDKMTSSYYYTGADDNGGVHTNSGVNNKAVYLMTDGGTFNGYTITGLGITKVAKLYYEVQTNLLTSGADYADLYEALYQGCLNLVGTAGITSSDCQQVRNATLAVEMNQQPVSGYNPEAPLCPAGQTPVNLFFDNLESGTGNWTFGVLSGTSRWGRVSGYAHSGTYSLYGNDYPATVSDSFAAMNTSVTLPANAYLHFAHAYGFEDSGTNYYDGGVLEYSTNGGASWNDAASLFDYNGYKGTIRSGFGNPLGGRSGFIADSHGYISSRLNLASLAGQSVRFRWRMGTDSSGYDLGWVVDDVRIYTCSSTSSSSIYLPLVLKNYDPSIPTPTPTFTPTPPPSWQVLVSTDFEGDFPGPWRAYDSDGATNGEYYWGRRNCRAFAGSYSGWAVGAGANGAALSCGSNYPNYALSAMDYGPFSLVGATAAELRYKVWHNTESNYDFVCHYASIDNANFYGTCWSGNSGGWVDRVFDLSNVYTLGNLLGQPNVWIRLRFRSDSSVTYPEGAYVDNIVLRRCPSGATCPPGGSSALPAGSRMIEFPFSEGPRK
jgi:Zn-dependent metalloprotease